MILSNQASAEITLVFFSKGHTKEIMKKKKEIMMPHFRLTRLGKGTL